MEPKLIKVIEAASAGDKKAFKTIYDRYYKQLFYLALKITGNYADANDAIQDTFLQIQNSLKDLRNPEYFNAWASKIVFSKCTAIFSRNKYIAMDPAEMKNISPDEARKDHIPDQSFHRKNDQEIVQQFISELRPKQKEILLLMYYMQLSIKEIALVLDIPEGTVKGRARIARACLKEKIEDYEKRENRKIDFNIASMETSLIGAFAIESAALHISIPAVGFMVKPPHQWMKFHSLVQSAGIITASAVVAVAGTNVVEAMEHKNEVPKQEIPIVSRAIHIDEQKQFNKVKFYLRNTDTSLEVQNAREAYYTLMEWGLNKRFMKDKTKEDIEMIQPVFDSLEEFGGEYWNRIIRQEWKNDFEDSKAKINFE